MKMMGITPQKMLRILSVVVVGRVNCPCPEQGDIQTANFQVQYLPQFYPQNLKITINPSTEIL